VAVTRVKRRRLEDSLAGSKDVTTKAYCLILAASLRISTYGDEVCAMPAPKAISTVTFRVGRRKQEILTFFGFF
jgi:hypothetical protein